MNSADPQLRIRARNGRSLSRPQILCVDDDVAVLGALQQQLLPFEERYDLALAANTAEAEELLDQQARSGSTTAMVIADEVMPGASGVDLLEKYHRRCPMGIKLLLTGKAGLDAITRAVNRAGLNGYIAKPWDEPDLRLTVENLLGKYELYQERERLLGQLQETNALLKATNENLDELVKRRTQELSAANQRLAQLAITDGLTGRYNHRYFHERLALEVERSSRSNMPLALLMIDVDHFKRYNDRFGHPAGDKVLRRIGELLAEGRRLNDIVARYGGEEFTVLLVDTPKEAAVHLAESLRDRVQREPMPLASPSAAIARKMEAPDSVTVTISIGVSMCPDDASDAGALTLAADAALYQAKRAGRNRVVCASDIEGREDR